MNPPDMNAHGVGAYPHIDAYLDGQLKPAERDAFETALRGDAALREQVERQRLIDASLKRQFPPSAAAAILANIQAGRTGPAASMPRPESGRTRGTRAAWQPYAIAAAILLCLAGGWWWWPRGDDAGQLMENPVAVGKPRPLIDVYNAEVASGFKPSWVCDPARFKSTMQRRYGVSLLAEIPSGITGWGLSYSGAITSNSTLLLATLDGKHVLVVMDKAARDKGQSLPPDCGLKMFKRTLGPLILYEVTPFDEERIAPAIKLDGATSGSVDDCPDARQRPG